MASPPISKTPWRSFQAEPPPKPKQGLQIGMLGGLAIAIGVGAIGAYMLDLHGHQCGSCGSKWKHFGAFNLGDVASHTCSSCGQVQWWKSGAPHVLHGSQFADRDGAPPPSLPRLEAPIVPPALAGPPRSSYDARDTFEYDPRTQLAFADRREPAYDPYDPYDPRPHTYDQRPPIAPSPIAPSPVGALRSIAARRVAPSSTALTYQPRRMPPR